MTQPDPTLQSLLEVTVESTGADFGDLQLVDASGQLKIAAFRGVGPSFLKAFETVTAGDGTSDGRALLLRRQVVVPDVELDASYARHRRAAAEAGFRSVHSTPLISRTGRVLGVISAHYRRPQQPIDKSLRLAQLYARFTAAYLELFRLAAGPRDQGERPFAQRAWQAAGADVRALVARVRANPDNESFLRTMCEQLELRVSGLVSELEKLSRGDGSPK